MDKIRKKYGLICVVTKIESLHPISYGDFRRYFDTAKRTRSGEREGDISGEWVKISARGRENMSELCSKASISDAGEQRNFDDSMGEEVEVFVEVVVGDDEATTRFSREG